MRGREKNRKSIKLSGRVYLKYIDDDFIDSPKEGDIFLYLNNDAEKHILNKNSYLKKGKKGFFKGEIYNGREWCLLDLPDFFEEKENYFSKSEKSIFAYDLCKTILGTKENIEVYKTYRNHYSTQTFEPGIYQGKKGHHKKKNT
jgi:hypothetical protein